MIIHPDVLAAHAEFGGDLELMQKAYEWSELKAEIERLRLSLSEARATGRREGMQEAAQYHEDAVTRIRNDPDAYKGDYMRPTYKRASNIHEYSAAAIRAAMEKAE